MYFQVLEYLDILLLGKYMGFSIVSTALFALISLFASVYVVALHFVIH